MKKLRILFICAAVSLVSELAQGIVVNGRSGWGDMWQYGWTWESYRLVLASYNQLSVGKFEVSGASIEPISNIDVNAGGGTVEVEIMDGAFSESFGMNRLDSNVFCRVSLDIFGGDFRCTKNPFVYFMNDFTTITITGGDFAFDCSEYVPEPIPVLENDGKWLVGRIKLEFDPDGGSVSVRHKLLKYGDTYGELPVPERAGYKFVAWQVDGEEVSAEDCCFLHSPTAIATASWKRDLALFEEVEPGPLDPNGVTYNCFLGGETLGGTFTLVVKKPKKGLATVDAILTKIDPATGKKVKTTGTVDVNTGFGAGGLAGLQLNARGVGGSFGGMPGQGAVDAGKAKDAAALAVMNGFNKRIYGLVFADAAGEEAYLTATFSTKGKVKVAGSYRGAKVSGSTVMSVGDRCAVPFVWSKKGVTVAFVLWFDKEKKTLLDVSGLGAGAKLVAAGSAEAPAATYNLVPNQDAVKASVPDAIPQTFDPIVLSFDGRKFTAAKAAKVSYKKGELTVDTSKGDNVTGLKLAYSKGVLKGSFTVYAVTGGKLVKNKFTVAGVLIDGVGYASGTNKKLPAIPLVLTK